MLPKLVPIGFLIMFFAWTTEAQEVKHASTVEQCRADQRLWLDELEDTKSALPDYRTLTGWGVEMVECKSVDPENRGRYYNVATEIESVMVMRLENFLERHGLYAKFIEEDKSGKR